MTNISPFDYLRTDCGKKDDWRTEKNRTDDWLNGIFGFILTSIFYIFINNVSLKPIVTNNLMVYAIAIIMVIPYIFYLIFGKPCERDGIYYLNVYAFGCGVSLLLLTILGVWR